MKAHSLTALFTTICCVFTFGFDPDGPPPIKDMAWTTKSLSRVIVPIINIDQDSIRGAANFISSPEVPAGYRPEIDISQITDKSRKISFSGKELTRLEAIGLLAAAADADILISAGKVTLIPHHKSEQDGGGNAHELPFHPSTAPPKSRATP